MSSKEIKQLKMAYSKSFKNINKAFFIDKSCGLTFFAEYLRYTRDYLILTKYNVPNEKIKTSIATITLAVAEFDAYITKQDVAQKSFHWNNFCELLKQNMEDWLKLNDSI